MIIWGFRPLSGNYISQSVFMDLDRIARGRVSVPCRGTTFLNMVQITLSLMKHTEFPSPVGELHFSMVLLLSLLRITLFPSPVGELHFSMSISNSTRTVELVSVPCRGTTFLNTIPAIPPPVWAHGRDCVGKIFLEK